MVGLWLPIEGPVGGSFKPFLLLLLWRACLRLFSCLSIVAFSFFSKVRMAGETSGWCVMRPIFCSTTSIFLLITFTSLQWWSSIILWIFLSSLERISSICDLSHSSKAIHYDWIKFSFQSKAFRDYTLMMVVIKVLQMVLCPDELPLQVALS